MRHMESVVVRDIHLTINLRQLAIMKYIIFGLFRARMMVSASTEHWRKKEYVLLMDSSFDSSDHFVNKETWAAHTGQVHYHPSFRYVTSKPPYNGQREIAVLYVS